MKISIKNSRKLIQKNGFSLIELVVVIAGLSTLSAISIPRVLELITISKIDEAKAIMNGYISDCLGQYRISTDASDFYNNAIPEDIDEVKLATLGYKVEGAKSKCSWTAIAPSDEKDELRYSFDYRISVEGKVLKTAEPAPLQRSLNSCRGWAGANCSLSAEKAAEFAAAAALAEKKNNCLVAYGKWKVDNGNGNTVTWNSSTKACDKVAWLFDGVPVADKEAYDALVLQKFGTVCQEWKEGKNQANYKSKIENGKGIGETITECNKAKYWFHSGRDFNTEVEWNTFNLNYQLQACNQSKLDAINKKHEGAFTFGPYKVPDPPCGTNIYLCEGKSYSSNQDFQNSPCVQRRIEEERRKAEEEKRKAEEEEMRKAQQRRGNKNGKGPCDGVKYNKGFCASPMFLPLDMCNCAPGGKWNK